MGELAANGLRRYVASTELFGALEGPALDDFTDGLRYTRVPAGKTVFLQGEPARTLYLVLDGRLRLTALGADGRREILSELVRGNCAGVAALVSGRPYEATAKAVRDTDLLEFTRDQFDALAVRHPHQVLLVAKRLLSVNGSVAARAHIETLAVVPASDEVPVGVFVQRLAESLSLRGEIIRRGPAGGEVWRGGEQVTTFRSHVAGTAHQAAPTQTSPRSLLINEADPVSSRWTEQCVSSADRIVVVACSDGDFRCAAVEETLLSSRQRLPAHRDLVLLHPNHGTPRRGTRRWLEQRYVDTHHHVCLDSAEDISRVGRLLTGNTISLVLSGGGARAFAHIGVIRALRDIGIPIDAVAGVSMGAIIGAQFALGWDPAEMLERNREGWIEKKPLVDYTIPAIGLISGTRFTQMLTWMFGDIRIEDLRIPYFCTSTNLTRAELMVHWDGLLRRWLRASVSLPGIAPPLPDHGELLADGSLVTNLPTEVMRVFTDGRIIASDVGGKGDLSVDPDYDDHPSAWRVLRSRLNPFGRPIGYPTLFDVMARTVMISAARAVERARGDVDFCVYPQVGKYRLFEWNAIDRIVDAGYRAALTQVAALKQLLPS